MKKPPLIWFCQTFLSPVTADCERLFSKFDLIKTTDWNFLRVILISEWADLHLSHLWYKRKEKGIDWNSKFASKLDKEKTDKTPWSERHGMGINFKWSNFEYFLNHDAYLRAILKKSGLWKKHCFFGGWLIERVGLFTKKEKHDECFSLENK